MTDANLACAPGALTPVLALPAEQTFSDKGLSSLTAPSDLHEVFES
jgi:hypothetical protein